MLAARVVGEQAASPRRARAPRSRARPSRRRGRARAPPGSGPRRVEERLAHALRRSGAPPAPARRPAARRPPSSPATILTRGRSARRARRSARAPPARARDRTAPARCSSRASARERAIRRRWRARLAWRRSLAPDWRRPESSPSPRMRRSSSARSKPLACSQSACQAPLPELARLVRLEQEAVRLVAAAPDAPAQLMQLREAEAVGVLDHHRGRVRDVDADLDHGRRDEHVHLGGRERAHRGRALGGLLAAVHEPDRRAARAPRRARRGAPRRRAPARSPSPRRAGTRRRPAAGARATARPASGGSPRACAARTTARDDRLPARRQLAQLGEVEVAVERERERARDRRRRHVQRVRAVALRERRPLLDAEAVLLVDDDHAQARRTRRSPRAARACRRRARRRPRRCAAGARAARPRGRSPVTTATSMPSGSTSAAHGRRVLLDEHLGRREQRGLRAALGRAQHRVHRDDGLARADVAEQQAAHRAPAREIAVDVAHAALLAAS